MAPILVSLSVAVIPSSDTSNLREKDSLWLPVQGVRLYDREVQAAGAWSHWLYFTRGNKEKNVCWCSGLILYSHSSGSQAKNNPTHSGQVFSSQLTQSREHLRVMVRGPLARWSWVLLSLQLILNIIASYVQWRSHGATPVHHSFVPGRHWVFISALPICDKELGSERLLWLLLGSGPKSRRPFVSISC